MIVDGAAAGTLSISPQDLPLAAAALNNLGLVQTDMNRFMVYTGILCFTGSTVADFFRCVGGTAVVRESHAMP